MFAQLSQERVDGGPTFLRTSRVPARYGLALVFCTFFFPLLSIVTGVIAVVVAEHYDALPICVRKALRRPLRSHPVASQERFEFGRSLNLDMFVDTQQCVRCGGSKCPCKIYSVDR